MPKPRAKAQPVPEAKAKGKRDRPVLTRDEKDAVTRRGAANKKHTVTKTKERTRATIQVSPPSKRTIKHKKAGKREPHSVEAKEKHTPSTRKVLLTMEQKDRRNKARRGTRGTEIANRRKTTKKIQMFVNANGERQRRIDPQPAQRVCSQWSRNLLITQRRTRMKR